MSQLSEEQLKKWQDLRLVGGSVNTSYKPNKFSPSYLNEILGNVTSTKVLCNDGSIQNQQSSPTAKYGDACAKNGGRSANQPIDFTKYEQVKTESLDKGGIYVPTKGKEDITKKLLGAYNQNLIIAVVLVAGYFAYKKFKK